MRDDRFGRDRGRRQDPRRLTDHVGTQPDSLGRLDAVADPAGADDAPTRTRRPDFGNGSCRRNTPVGEGSSMDSRFIQIVRFTVS
jgi:hypothetical protein